MVTVAAELLGEGDAVSAGMRATGSGLETLSAFRMVPAVPFMVLMPFLPRWVAGL
jgi:hypothetical protein